MTKNSKEKSRRPDESDSRELALPEQELPSIYQEFLHPFDELIQSFMPGSMRSFFTELGEKEPVVDIHNRGDHYVLTAELPGMDKDDVEVRVDANAIELRAQKKTENEDKSADSMQRSSSLSYFDKYLSLPEGVLPEKVVGTMKNGVLELRLPKKEPTVRGASRRVALK